MKTLSILFSDIRDYTSRSAGETRAGVVEMVRRHREIAAPIIEKHNGAIVKSLGDGLLVTFESATEAALAGLGIGEALRRHNEESFDDRRKLEVRIAVCTGEVALEERDGVGRDVLGPAVNLASRIQQLAGAGDVLLSETTHAILNKREVGSERVGAFELKGLSEPVNVYRAVARQPGK
jgi:adenylate cyclase